MSTTASMETVISASSPNVVSDSTKPVPSNAPQKRKCPRATYQRFSELIGNTPLVDLSSLLSKEQQNRGVQVPPNDTFVDALLTPDAVASCDT